MVLDRELPTGEQLTRFWADADRLPFHSFFEDRNLAGALRSLVGEVKTFPQPLGGDLADIVGMAQDAAQCRAVPEHRCRVRFGRQRNAEGFTCTLQPALADDAVVAAVPEMEHFVGDQAARTAGRIGNVVNDAA